MRHAILSAMLLLATVSAFASGNVIPSAHESVEQSALKSWKISLVPLIASQALDSASSYGMRELNPLLADPNGGFGMKATGIKLGVTGAAVAVEYLIVRKYPRSAGVISKLNWTTGIVTTGFAVHNYAIK